MSVNEWLAVSVSCDAPRRTQSRTMLRTWLLFVIAGVLTFATEARAADEVRFNRVIVAPTKTSIYIGTVSMTMPPFERTALGFESTYHARVFPYFFSNEEGRLRIDITDAMLAQLAQGQKINFHGLGTRTDGAQRRIEGSAEPTDAQSGKLTVRVSVSKRIQLIFHTTYRFEDSAADRK